MRTGRSFVRGAGIALLFAVSLFASRALAQDSEAAPPPASPEVVEARRHIANGEAFATANNWDGALVEFQRAYELLTGNPNRYIVLFNIGQCHERMFRYDEAITYYQRYLDEGGPEAEDRATVQATMRALDGLLGTLNITANVPRAEIWVDQRQVGVYDASHHSVRIPAGIHPVELRTRGYQNSAQQIQIAARSSVDVRFSLERLSDYHGLPAVWFWTIATTSAVILATGLAVGIVALEEHGRLQALANDMSNPDRFAVQDSAKPLALGADICFGIGGAFAIGALVVAFMTDWGGRPAAPAENANAPHASLVPVLAPGFGGLALTGGF